MRSNRGCTLAVILLVCGCASPKQNVAQSMPNEIICTAEIDEIIDCDSEEACPGYDAWQEQLKQILKEEKEYLDSLSSCVEANYSKEKAAVVIQLDDDYDMIDIYEAMDTKGICKRKGLHDD